MSEPTPFERPLDPVYHTVPLRHVLELPVMGIVVRFESNSPAGIAAAREAFGTWEALAARPELIDQGGIRVRVIVHDGDEGPAPHAPVAWRLPDADRLLIHTPGSIGLVDMGRRDGVAFVTPALLADRAHAQYALLHTLVVPLVDTYDRYPVHAALISRGGAALLLAGPAGTGKSTLAFEAHRHGLFVLSDDVTHIQLTPVFRVWGELPGRVYLVPSARAHFPELAGHAPTLHASGVEKVVVRFPYDWSVLPDQAPAAVQARVCLLERNGGHAAVSEASAEDVATFLGDGLGIARVMYGPRMNEAIARVAEGGGWKLSLSDNPADAIPYLKQMLTALDQRD